MTARSNREAALRMLCVPYAGGGASVYRDWHRLLRDDVEVVAVQLPGRENRFSEVPLTTIGQLIDELAPLVCALSDKPLVLFGHSLGALICFELVLRLERLSQSPALLFVSGMNCPTLPREEECIHELDDARFLERIRQFNGTPREVIEDSEMMGLWMPVLRADFRLSESYQYPAHRPRVRCPLAVLGGDSDASVSREDLPAWADVTAATADIHVFSGGHFFITEDRTSVIRLINSRVGTLLATFPR